MKQPLPAWRAPVSSTVTKGESRKPRAEHRFLLGAEQLQLGGHEPHHLALRDRQARSGQQRHDPLTGHLTLKMQRQNQTMQMRAAAAHDARRQFSRYRPPVRHRPPLAPVERHLGFERNILNDDVFVALVTRTRRRRRRQRHRAVDAQLRHAGTATARRRRIRLARLLRRKTIGRLFHARRLHWRSRRQTLQTPDLVLKLSGSRASPPPAPRSASRFLPEAAQPRRSIGEPARPARSAPSPQANHSSQVTSPA